MLRDGKKDGARGSLWDGLVGLGRMVVEEFEVMVHQTVGLGRMAGVEERRDDAVELAWQEKT